MKKQGISRRSFLKTGSSVAAASTLTPALVAMLPQAISADPSPLNKWPGRVVINYNNTHTASQITGTAADQTTLRKMVDDAIKLLTGQSTVGAAWKALFPASLTAGSKIAIKINLLSTGVVPGHWFIVRGIVEGLMQMDIGGSTLTRSNITIYDGNNSSGVFTAKGYTAANFPGITLVNSDTLSSHGDGARGLNYANSLYNANYLINIPGIRGHGTEWSSAALGGATLGYKSHLGTYPTSAHNDPQNYLRDYMCVGPIYNKHVLTVGNAIFATNYNNGPSTSSVPGNYYRYAQAAWGSTLSTRVNCDTIIMSTDPVSAEFQMYKVMSLNANPTKPYTTTSMPNYLKASAGIAALTPSYNIGVLDETLMNVGKIKNEVFLGWSGLEALPGNTRAAFKLAVRPNPAVSDAYFDIWAPQALAGKKAVLEVYNAQGRLVFKAEPSIPGACMHVTWNGRSMSGRPVASGKYVAYVKVGREVLQSTFTLVR